MTHENSQMSDLHLKTLSKYEYIPHLVDFVKMELEKSNHC